MSQPVDLEELTRLHELSKTETLVSYRPHGVAFNVALLESFPALRDELVRLREEREQWRMSSVCREYKRQLDEAKVLLESLVEMDDDMNAEDNPDQGTYTGAYYSYYKGQSKKWQAARTFLASLAGSCNNCNDTGTGTFAGDPCHVCKPQQQEQPTQGEVCIHDWQLHQGAVVYKCTKCGDKTTTPPEVEGGAL